MADITGFLSEHPGWSERLRSDRLWLSIPRGLVDRFGDLKENAPNWLTKGDAWQAEMDFLDLIGESDGYGAIGMRQENIVNYPLFKQQPRLSSFVTDERFEELGLGQHIESAQVARDQLDQAQRKQTPIIEQRLLGYAGWLITNPIYVREASQLDESWRALTTPQSFPSEIIAFKGTPVIFKELFDEDGMPKRFDRNENSPAQEFAEQMANFYKRWGILQLPDWDFPVPQGPLHGEKNILSFVRNNDLTGQVVYIPGWYEVIDSRDNVLKTLKSDQGKVKDDRFIEGDGWPITSHARYAGMFMCLNALRAIEQRSGKLAEKSPDYELVLELMTEWLDEELPESRGRGKIGKGEGGKEDIDKASRIRRLILLSKQRLGRSMSGELKNKKSKSRSKLKSK